MDYKHISYLEDERMGIITLTGDAPVNTLNDQIIGELKDAFHQAELSDDVKIIVLKATGNVFCLGADEAYLKQIPQNSAAENQAQSRHFMEMLDAIYRHRKVVIAQIEGHAIASGCGLATVCDFCFTVPDARFGFTEVQYGFVPSLMAVFLTSKIGEGRAKAMLLSGRLISADEAKGIGLINEVLDPRDIDDFVRKFAIRLCRSNSAHAMSETKKVIADSQNLSMEKALELAFNTHAEARWHEDCKKGVAALLRNKVVNW